MRTLTLTGGSLGRETMYVRCDLSQASAPVLVDYDAGAGWQHTQYQCADARHTLEGLTDIAHTLARRAMELSEDEYEPADVTED